jgi:hypothetical protein
MENNELDIETLLKRNDAFLEKIKNPSFAQAFYAALCNVIWYYGTDTSKRYSCSWRYAGQFISDVRNFIIPLNHEDYMDFYCSGINGNIPEGIITQEVLEFMETMDLHPIKE